VNSRYHPTPELQPGPLENMILRGNLAFPLRMFFTGDLIPCGHDAF
jgi:hypothetical protein